MHLFPISPTRIQTLQTTVPEFSSCECDLLFGEAIDLDLWNGLEIVMFFL
jgi:hypothetical protein